MKAHCESIRHIVGRSSQLLQDLLASPVSWQHQHGGDVSLLDSSQMSPARNTSSPDKHISHKLIELIGDLSSLSLQAGEIYVETRKKEKETVKCIEHLRLLVQKQQEEIIKLSKPTPLLAEMAIDTSDLMRMDDIMRDNTEKRQQEAIVQLTNKTDKLKLVVEKLLYENKKLKSSLAKSTMLLKAQEALMEEYEMDKRYEYDVHRRVPLDIFSEESHHQSSRKHRPQSRYDNEEDEPEAEQEEELVHNTSKAFQRQHSKQANPAVKLKVHVPSSSADIKHASDSHSDVIKSPPRSTYTVSYRYSREDEADIQPDRVDEIHESAESFNKSFGSSLDSSGLMASFQSSADEHVEHNNSSVQSSTEHTMDDTNEDTSRRISMESVLMSTIDSLPPPPPPISNLSPTADHQYYSGDLEESPSHQNLSPKNDENIADVYKAVEENQQIFVVETEGREECVDAKTGETSQQFEPEVSWSLEIDSPLNRNTQHTTRSGDTLVLSHESQGSWDASHWQQDGSVEDSFMMIQEYYDPQVLDQVMQEEGDSYISSPERQLDNNHSDAFEEY